MDGHPSLRRRVAAGAWAGGPEKITALQERIRRLVELGHQRLVILAREERPEPYPDTIERTFLYQVQSHGIATGSFSLPHWDERPGGFQESLDTLFAHTPPTALLIEEMPFFVAAVHHLAKLGISGSSGTLSEKVGITIDFLEGQGPACGWPWYPGGVRC